MKDEYDFSHAKRASEIDHLTQLRAAQTHQKKSLNMKTIADDSIQSKLSEIYESSEISDTYSTALLNAKQPKIEGKLDK